MLDERLAVQVPKGEIHAGNGTLSVAIQQAEIRIEIRPPCAARSVLAEWTNMADEDLLAQIEALKADNERLKQKKNTSISMKVSEKGAVSVYGLGRFPVTLYQEQWTKLLSLSDEIQQFIGDNKAQLKVKEAS